MSSHTLTNKMYGIENTSIVPSFEMSSYTLTNKMYGTNWFLNPYQSS